MIYGPALLLKVKTVFSQKLDPILLFHSGSGAMPSFLGHWKGHIIQGLADSGSTKSGPRERKRGSRRVTDVRRVGWLHCSSLQRDVPHLLAITRLML